MTRSLTRIGPKGQTVIPKPVRDELDLKPGDSVYIYTHEGHAHIEPATSHRAWRESFKHLPELPVPRDFDVERAIEASLEEDSSRF